MKKIYFAGSIRGGRGDAGLYGRIISRLKEKHIVLTEHVGAASVTEMGEQGKSDACIYEQDIAWLKESDMVIAECSTPSLGVGYELAYAEKLGKPVHIVFHTGRGCLSSMLTGDGYFHIHYYTTERELFSILDGII